jgi:hypothetical protein
VLLNLLPGLRELRAPLAAGYLWLAAAWIAFSHELPAHPHKATGLVAVGYHLRDAASPFGIAAAISFAAYIVGTLSVAISDAISEPLRTSLTRRSEADLMRWIKPLVDLAAVRIPVSDARRDLAKQIDAETDNHDAVIEAVNRQIRRSVMNERDRITVRLLVSQPELYQAIDRAQAESGFRFAVGLATPAVIVAVASATMETSQVFVLGAGIVLGALSLFMPAFMVTQGGRGDERDPWVRRRLPIVRLLEARSTAYGLLILSFVAAAALALLVAYVAVAVYQFVAEVSVSNETMATGAVVFVAGGWVTAMLWTQGIAAVQRSNAYLVDALILDRVRAPSRTDPGSP